MTWIRVTLVPNDEHLDDAPRAAMMVDVDRIACFQQTPGAHVMLWTSWDPLEPSFQLAESMDEINALIQAEQRREEQARADACEEAEHRRKQAQRDEHERLLAGFRGAA